MLKKVAIATFSVFFLTIILFKVNHKTEIKKTTKSEKQNILKTKKQSVTMAKKQAPNNQRLPASVQKKSKEKYHQFPTFNADSQDLKAWQNKLISKLRLDRKEVKGLSVRHMKSVKKELRGETKELEWVKLKYMVNGIEKAYDAYINKSNGHIEHTWNHLIVDQHPLRKKALRFQPNGGLENED